MSQFRLASIVVLIWLGTEAHAASMVPSIGIASPDGRILVNVTVAEGRASYSVALDGKEILQKSRLGVVRDDADFSQGVDVTANYLARAGKLEKIDERYELLTSKRRQNAYRANRRVVELATPAGARMDGKDDRGEAARGLGLSRG